MRDLVDRDPQPEVAGPEREPLLEREDVAADVVDGVGRGVVVEHEQVVLAEHPLREVAEQHPGLGAGDPAADRRDRAAGHALADARGERREQAAHRRDVGRDPRRAVDDLRPGRARRPQAGVVGDERLGLGGDGVEVVAQRAGEVRGGERLAPANRRATRSASAQSIGSWTAGAGGGSATATAGMWVTGGGPRS